MNVTVLKAELRKRGRPVSDLKDVIVTRLKEALLQGVPVTESVPEGHTCIACIYHLDVATFWEVLTPNPVSVPLPENEDTTLRPPTERDVLITEK